MREMDASIVLLFVRRYYDPMQVRCSDLMHASASGWSFGAYQESHSRGTGTRNLIGPYKATNVEVNERQILFFGCFMPC